MHGVNKRNVTTAFNVAKPMAIAETLEDGGIRVHYRDAAGGDEGLEGGDQFRVVRNRVQVLEVSCS